jgi:antitoxin ChpS
MELIFKKLGNSTGLTFPATFLRELGLTEGQAVSVEVSDEGVILLHPKMRRKRYTAAELNAQCDLKAPMPEDLQDWDNSPAFGAEAR